jgi:hypothetical protein
MAVYERDCIDKYICELELYDQANAEYIPFKLWDKQKELNDLVETGGNLVILKKRQVGASQMTGANSLIHCLFELNFSVLILSKTGNQDGGDARLFLDRIRDMYNRIPDLNELIYRWNNRIPVSRYLVSIVLMKHYNPCIKGADSGVSMRFLNKSYILSLPAQKGRSFSAKRIVIDEAGFIRPNPSNITLKKVFENIFASIEKTNGQLIIISTANGLDEYADVYLKAVSGENSFIPFFFSCYDDPTFTKEKRKRIEIDFGENHVNQEYPENPEQAFIASGDGRFDKKAMNRYEKISKKIKPRIRGDIQIIAGKDTIIKLSMKTAPLTVYQKRDNRASYLLAADVAEGLVQGDWSVAKIYNRLTHRQVAEYRDHIEPKEFGTICASLGRIYNNAVVAIEANNHGHSTLTRLTDTEKYPEELIFAHGILQREQVEDEYTGSTRLGWLTTNKNRPLIINNMAQLMLEGQIPYFTAEDMAENRTFIRKKGGKVEAEDGFYDDRVMTNAIGIFLLNSELFNSYYKLMEFNSFQKCRFCKYYKSENNGFGTCGKSGRYCLDDQCCILFREIPMHTPDADLDRIKYKSGYIPLRS